MLEAAWASVLIERDGVLYTPREDGRILPGTSRPEAIQADLQLQPGDRLLRQLVAGGTRAGRARGNQPGTARR